MSEVNTEAAKKTRKTVLSSLFIVVGMFGFGFALVPLYEIFCEITGLNGKTGDRYEYQSVKAQVDETRQVKVQFLASNSEDMIWEFRPMMDDIKVNPGALNEVSFYVRNPTDKPMVAQAIPSISPGLLAQYMHKTECFCFQQQLLQPGEEMEMPLRFIIDMDIPKDRSTLTLSYTLFDVTEKFDSQTIAQR